MTGRRTRSDGFYLNTDEPTRMYRGFQIAFANGYVISVQWGEYNYSDRQPKDAHSSSAEVAVFPKEGGFVRLGPDDDVLGYQTPEDVARLIAQTAQIPPGTPPGMVSFAHQRPPLEEYPDDDSDPFDLE